MEIFLVLMVFVTSALCVSANNGNIFILPTFG